MRRKGELSSGAVDRGWPYQVAVRQIDGQNLGHIAPIGGFPRPVLREHLHDDFDR